MATRQRPVCPGARWQFAPGSTRGGDSVEPVTANFLTPPIDPIAAANLAERGLRFALVDTSDPAVFGAWFQAMNRGFHGGIVDDAHLPERLEGSAWRRTAGAWDDTSADALSPVATASSWISDLTVPGERSVPAWAISTITVAPTHRRRGIARNLLEAELRTAAQLGVPVAILTVSEATIYSRFGFAPSTFVASWKVDTRRARWNGPIPAGRVQLLPIEAVRDRGGLDLLESARLGIPGQIQFDGMLWSRLFGESGSEEARQIRVVRYDDQTGTPRGFAIYSVDKSRADSTAEVRYLITTTEDASAALWNYLLELDLVATVTAEMRPVDESFLWQITDARAAAKTGERDHLWTRILDVKAALEARRYAAPGRMVIDVVDPLGFAAGRFLLDITADGTALVTPSDEPTDLSLTVNELSAIYLGGVSVTTLTRAGRITELTPGAAAAAEASFHSAVTPWLSIWF
jgi:predicted acetyltransferase